MAEDITSHLLRDSASNNINRMSSTPEYDTRELPGGASLRNGSPDLWDEEDPRFMTNASQRSRPRTDSSNSLESDYDGLIQRGAPKASEWDDSFGYGRTPPMGRTPDGTRYVRQDASFTRETVGTGTPWR